MNSMARTSAAVAETQSVRDLIEASLLALRRGDEQDIRGARAALRLALAVIERGER
jgi:hypothetical protein